MRLWAVRVCVCACVQVCAHHASAFFSLVRSDLQAHVEWSFPLSWAVTFLVLSFSSLYTWGLRAQLHPVPCLFVFFKIIILFLFISEFSSLDLLHYLGSVFCVCAAKKLL